MKLRIGLFAAAAALSIAAGTLSAQAQYSNEFTPAKLLAQGKTSSNIAGSGLVKVQVQVNADGTHKVIKVDSSTNSGDNQAALDIAQSSTYRPAHRGTTPVTSFYTFVFKFNGKSLVSAGDASTGGGSSGGSSGGGAAGAQIAASIRNHQYSQATHQAQAALLANPSDDYVRQLLGVSTFYANDYAASAAAFDKVGTITKEFQPLAAQAFAAASVQVAQTDAAQSLTFAQKAASLDPSTNSKFALGVAQVANKNYADAVTTLKAVHASIFADPKATAGAKMGVDSRLLEAYSATGDNADAQAINAEMKQIDPSSNASSRVLGNHYLQAGSQAQQAKNYAEALKNYDAAAALNDSQVSVTANTQAAFTVASMDKPDYAKMKSYADKAIALAPNDAAANFAEGIALTGQWATGGSTDAKAKSQAQDALTKADTLAKSAGNESLALQIETFMKNSIK